jgi:hypothetical protein
MMCEHVDRTISQAGDVGKGLSIASAPYSPNYQEDDILSKPSASSLHQIKQMHELGCSPFPPAVVEHGSWSTVITEVYGSLVGNDLTSESNTMKRRGMWPMRLAHVAMATLPFGRFNK